MPSVDSSPASSRVTTRNATSLPKRAISSVNSVLPSVPRPFATALGTMLESAQQTGVDVQGHADVIGAGADAGRHRYQWRSFESVDEDLDGVVIGGAVVGEIRIRAPLMTVTLAVLMSLSFASPPTTVAE